MTFRFNRQERRRLRVARRMYRRSDPRRVGNVPSRVVVPADGNFAGRRFMSPGEHQGAINQWTSRFNRMNDFRQYWRTRVRDAIRGPFVRVMRNRLPPDAVREVFKRVNRQ